MLRREGLSASVGLFSRQLHTMSPQQNLENFAAKRVVKSRLLDEDGDTALHKHCLLNDAEEVKEFMATIGPDVCATMATITNNVGQLPSDIIKMRNWDKVQKKEVSETLLATLQAIPVKEISEKINLKDILDPHLVSHHPALAHNLAVGVEIANEVRAEIQASSTHPQMNRRPFEEKAEIEKRIKSIRDRLDSEPFSPEVFEKYSQAALKEGAGNCYEFSCATSARFKKRLPFLHNEIYELVSGDHIFVVIDRDPSCHPHKYWQWNDSVVAVDAWRGDIISGKDINKKLTDYRYFRQSDGFITNASVSFNPSHHLLSRITEREAASNFSSSVLNFWKVKEKPALSQDPIDEVRKILVK